MSRPLIYGLMAAAALALASTTPSQAKLVCTRGKMVTPACTKALESQISNAKLIVSCLQAMESEYLGVNGAAGAGQNFDAKKQECLALFTETKKAASVDSATADMPVDENVIAAQNAILDWAQK